MNDHPVFLQPYTLRLRQTFTISRGGTDEKETLLIRWGDAIGEAAPSVHYGHSVAEMQAYLSQRLQEFGDKVTIDDLSAICDAIPEEFVTARCGMEMVKLDYLAKQMGLPLYKYVNCARPENVVSSFTITPGTEAELRAQLETAVPFDTLKLKVGFARDLDFIDFVLKRKSCRLRLDANGGWTVDAAIERLHALAGYPIDFVEQPLSNPTVGELDTIKTKVDCAIFLDESIVHEADIDLYKNVIDGVNLKAARCGGVARVKALANLARQHRLKLMLGCMIETAVGITAALHLASLFDYFDLDAILLTENDPFWGAHFDGQKLILPEGNGIGVTTGENTLA